MKKNINHRFGVEIELNSFDGFSKNDELSEPLGIKNAAETIKSTLNQNVDVTTWHTTINSNSWLVKPDSSCGFEICSPILKGKSGLDSLLSVVKAIKKDGRFQADSRCSFHVHFELPSKSIDYISSLIVNWIKCELFFFLMIPNSRKQSRYCQLMGLSDVFCNKTAIDAKMIFNKISDYKFYSLSIYHFKKSNRNTVEFRIMDNSACMDSYVVENWILLLNRFINKSSNVKIFDENNNLLTPIKWLDIQEVFDFLEIKKNDFLFDFIKKRIKSFSINSAFFSLSVYKKIFEIYFSEAFNFLEKK